MAVLLSARWRLKSSITPAAGGPNRHVCFTTRSPAAAQFTDPNGLTTTDTAIFNSTLTRDVALPVNATVNDIDNLPLSAVDAFKEIALPWYSDQALPFDITITAANEYGAAACAKIFGVEILNESFGMSIDDAVAESQATFVARSVSPLQRLRVREMRKRPGASPVCGRMAAF